MGAETTRELDLSIHLEEERKRSLPHKLYSEYAVSYSYSSIVLHQERVVVSPIRWTKDTSWGQTNILVEGHSVKSHFTSYEDFQEMVSSMPPDVLNPLSEEDIDNFDMDPSQYSDIFITSDGRVAFAAAESDEDFHVDVHLSKQVQQHIREGAVEKFRERINKRLIEIEDLEDRLADVQSR